MTSIYIVGAILIISVLILILIYLRSARQKSVPVNLYFEALRNENMGRFELAEAGYRAALEEAERSRFHDDLRIKIAEKIRLMQTVINYQRSISFASFNHQEQQEAPVPSN